MQIDHDRQFPTLPSAPIVEAVLYFKATTSAELSQDNLRTELSETFPNYEIANQHNLEAAFRDSTEGVEFHHRSNWEGLKLTASGEESPNFVCQFKRDGVIFSQLAPYRDWQVFQSEALKFWKKFVDIGNPVELAQIDVRFISQIPMENAAQAKEFIESPDEPLSSIGVFTDRYFHQNGAQLSNAPYSINLVRAVQPNIDSKSTNSAMLLVDIAVTTSGGSIELDQLESKLRDLRFIKNEVFFTVMKDAVKKFSGAAI